jgi:hypothetical protein
LPNANETFFEKSSELFILFYTLSLSQPHWTDVKYFENYFIIADFSELGDNETFYFINFQGLSEYNRRDDIVVS